MGRRVIPHWYNWKVIASYTLFVVLVGAIGSSIPLIQRFRASEVQATMTATPAPIDGQRAYGYLKKICELGPRIAGTDANERQRKMVAEHFTKAGGEVTEQRFSARHPLTGRPLQMVNVIGSWHPERPNRVLISAHCDTRPQADQEQDLERRRKPFIGANDCASGVALLMEIANHLDKLETPWGVDLVLFDGEELVYGNNAPHEQYFLGSKIFARHYADARRAPGPRKQYHAGILLDMVGGKDLVIRREQNSLQEAPALMREVWAVARQLDSKVFSSEIGADVSDDHIPLNAARIPTIDLIDFPWPFWHTIDDVPDNCSAESLAEVGRVLTAWLSQPRRGRR
jgi:glutaminyl-peptide cyclotransferase